jgi:cytoskeletal protein RodZ
MKLLSGKMEEESIAKKSKVEENGDVEFEEESEKKSVLFSFLKSEIYCNIVLLPQCIL